MWLRLSSTISIDFTIINTPTSNPTSPPGEKAIAYILLYYANN